MQTKAEESPLKLCGETIRYVEKYMYLGEFLHEKGLEESTLVMVNILYEKQNIWYLKSVEVTTKELLWVL